MMLPTVTAPIRLNHTDDPVEILRFAVDEQVTQKVALASLVDIRGGSARSLGAHVAVAEDGRFCGYVSGGCVEAAIASEALLAMKEGRDRCVRYGEGSPFFDIALPCGGGITVAIHLLRQPEVIHYVLDLLEDRQTAGLAYFLSDERLGVIQHAPQFSGLHDGVMHTVYRPSTRLVLSGQTCEAQRLERLAVVAGYDVHLCGSDLRTSDIMACVDAYSAIVLLHHDLDEEGPMLEASLRSNAFYVGALGSTRTHKKRLKRLRKFDFSADSLARIRAPIGLFGPVRDATSLALSVLADVAATRLETFR